MKSKKQTREKNGRFETKYYKEINEEADILIKAQSFSSVAGFGLQLGYICKATLYKWAEKYPEFSYTMSKALMYLENKVYEDVEAGANATWAIFNLKTNYKAIEYAEQLKIDQKERELNARISGEISDEKEIIINFTDAVDPRKSSNDSAID